MPIDAWISACCGGEGTIESGMDEAVALTKLMVGAYEAWRTEQKYVFA